MSDTPASLSEFDDVKSEGTGFPSEPELRVALTIAGSDPSGGAGIQADLKTFTVHSVYGASVITALTAQSSLGVRGVHNVPASFVAAQLAAIQADLNVSALKTGMLATAENVELVADGMRADRWLGQRPSVVIDPVMVATSGGLLLEPDAIALLRGSLFPVADLVTPNLAEAAHLCSRDIATNLEEMAAQGQRILEFGPRAVLVKGGHLAGPDGEEHAVDVLVMADGVEEFRSPRIDSPHTHGSGCTLSAAICANLAKGSDLVSAVRQAKAFVNAAITSAALRPVGHGRAPLDHFAKFDPGD